MRRCWARCWTLRDRRIALLAAARREGRQIRNLPPELSPTDAKAACAVAHAVAKEPGWETLGWKIAGTTPAMRERHATFSR